MSSNGTRFHSLQTLRELHALIGARKAETAETYSMVSASLREHVEANAFSVHMEMGTEAEMRETVGLQATRGTKFCNSLLDAERLLGKTIRCVESLGAQDQIVTVEALLQKMGTGVYGICTSCGRLIPKERLEAVPNTTQCVRCKDGGR